MLPFNDTDLVVELDSDKRPFRVDRLKTGVTEEEATFLYGIAIALRPTCIAEVGTGSSRSLKAFCDAAKYLKLYLELDCQVWSCDTDLGFVENARNRLREAHVIHGPVDDMVKAMPNAPELCFIDGDHRRGAVRHDWEALKEVARPGAAFLFHDARREANVRGAYDVVREIGGHILLTPRQIGIWSKC